MYTYITKYTHKKNRVDINHLKYLRANSCNVCRTTFCPANQKVRLTSRSCSHGICGRTRVYIYVPRLSIYIYIYQVGVTKKMDN